MRTTVFYPPGIPGANEKEVHDGVFNPNQSNRNFQAQAQAQAQNFQKNFHKHNQAIIKQNNERWAANRAGAARASRRATADGAGNVAPADIRKSHHGPLRPLLGLLILSLVAGAGIFESQTGWAASAVVAGGGVSGSVRPNTAWNFGQGPL